ncbi:MAG: HutD family protein [Solirubrobacterales bacterium]
MNLKILSRPDFTTTKWSGGDTTQLYIYPEDSSYAERNFLFRISSATVTDEKSTFTKLESVFRKIMVLSGEMTLEHVGRYSKVLKEFDQDSFMGDWDTISFGKVIDFNLMTKYGCVGRLENIKVMPDSKAALQLTSNKSNKVVTTLYPIEENMTLLLGQYVRTVVEKNLVIIEQEPGEDGNVLVIYNENKNKILEIVMAEVIYE